MSKWARFWVMNVVALVGLLLVIVGHISGAIGAVFGAFFVLILPGYAFVDALIGSRVKMIERVTLSIAMSAAILMVGGLLLNILPGGLQPGWWALFIWVIVVGCSLVVLLKTRQDRSEPLSALHIPTPRKRDVALALGAILIVVAGIGVALHSAQSRPDGGFTQLWILPGPTGTQGELVNVGVRNDELTPQTYQLNVQVNGTAARTYRIDLKPGQQWQQTIEVAFVGQLSGSVTVEATLYRPSVSAQPYRRVHLVLVAGGAAPSSQP